ncbi:hypothetical protein [Pontibacter sp. H249]|uniref:hypothetical protein n=1 Tax=Pontibacter sp. H249 TaxID=3133420 RepID=UPI0030C0085B
MKKIQLILLLLIISGASYGQKLMLFGGDNHKEYLGCLNCSEYSSESVWNEYSSYGNEYNSKSIWNDYGTYGNEYSKYCPWNEYASAPPVIVDEDGNFYGYFTLNRSQSKRTQNEFFIYVLENYKLIRENFDEFVDELNL